MKRVLVEDARISVAEKCATHLLENILGAVIFQVAKGHGMPLLQMPEAAVGGYVLKISAAIVMEHSIRQQRFICRLAGAEIDVEPTVVVKVAKVRAHDEDRPVEMHLLGYVGKSSVAIVVVEAGRLCAMRQAELKCADVLHGIGVISGGKYIRPAVVVIVEEPGGETVSLLPNSG